MQKEEKLIMLTKIGPGLITNMSSSIYAITQACTSNFLSFMMQLALKPTHREQYLKQIADLQDLLTIK